MNRTVKSKLIHLWNHTLRSLMIRDGKTDHSHSLDDPSYEALSSILSAIPDLMFELDEEGRYWDVRVLRPELLVAPAEELIGHTINEALPAEAARTAMQAIEEANKNGYSHGKHLFLPTPAGERWFEISIAKKEAPANSETDPGSQRFIALSRDINDRKLAFLEAEKLAYQDPLTELPNRYAFKEGRLPHLESQQSQTHYSAILFLDLDDFKHINDRLGHHAGDRLLKAVADRLGGAVREDDIVVRWGEMNFLY
jgi:GGDEF domain-containing protein